MTRAREIITQEADGYVAACPTCEWESEPYEFKGRAQLDYWRHAEEHV